MTKYSKICADCVKNDPVDISCGGPDYLGFDFYVQKDKVKEMKDFVSTTLSVLEVPVVEIYIGDETDVTPKTIWDKEGIFECIKDDATYLQREKQREKEREKYYNRTGKVKQKI